MTPCACTASGGRARDAEHALLATAYQLMTQLVPRQQTAKGHRALVGAAVDQMEGRADLLGVLVAVAYPDRIALRRDSSNRCKHTSRHANA